jgi:hypothetical protein
MSADRDRSNIEEATGVSRAPAEPRANTPKPDATLKENAGCVRVPDEASSPAERPRVARVDAPDEPVRLEQWRDTIEANFPSLVRPAEVCLSVVAQLLINDVSNPFALALVDVPSSGKTITLNFFAGEKELTYTSDNFTPAAFVSHASNVKREDLGKVDLLPRIRHRTLIVRELGSVFGAKDDDLIKSFGILTRVLDGEGLQTDSGVHGQRGYQGDYVFMLLAGTPPIPPRVFKVMANYGSRLFFLALHTPDEEEDDLIAQNLGEDRKCKEEACKAITGDYLRTLWAANPNGITWNKADDSKECLRVIAKCARLLAHLRGAINVWSVGDDGEKLSHSVPIIEKPNRINCLFYNLSRGHALACGRRQITPEDLWPVLDLTFDSAPRTRAKVFRALTERGMLTTSEVENLLRCSPPTARKEMEALAVLGVTEKDSCPDKAGSPETAIRLHDRFKWFTSPECQALLKNEHTPLITSVEAAEGENETHTPCKSFHLANVTTPEQVKENAPCVCAKDDCLTCTDGKCHLRDACEAEFNSGKTMFPFSCPEWVRLYPEESFPYWQDALKQALAKPCEVCEEPLTQEPYIWFYLADGVGQCANCRETQWWGDGYEIDQFGYPFCWNHAHTREQRIAERDCAMLERATKEWKESEEGRALLEKARRECERLGVYKHARKSREADLTPSEPLTEATALFNPKPGDNDDEMTL